MTSRRQNMRSRLLRLLRIGQRYVERCLDALVFLDVGGAPEPFRDSAVGGEHRIRSDEMPAILTLARAQAKLDLVWLTCLERLPPPRDHAVYVFRMHDIQPAG